MRALAAVAVLTLAAAARGAEADLDAVFGALRGDRSAKVRAQAAIVLGARGGPDVAAPLAQALASDPDVAVRLAAASAIARVGGPGARDALEAAARGDRDARVRDAAARALAALAPEREAALAFSIEETSGHAAVATRTAFRDAIARHLRDRGYAVVERGAGYRLKPSLLRVDVEQGSEATVVAVKAALVAVDGGGRMAAMLEAGARLRAAGKVPVGDVARYAVKAADAAAGTLCDDLAARLR
jgi:hypothetical protein